MLRSSILYEVKYLRRCSVDAGCMPAHTESNSKGRVARFKSGAPVFAVAGLYCSQGVDARGSNLTLSRVVPR